MRTALIVVVLLLLAVLGYAYKTNPTGCAKVGQDVMDVLQSLSSSTPPKSASSDNAPATASAAPVPPPPTVAVSPLPAPTASGPTPTIPPPQLDETLVPLKTWTPPAVIPAQPNWSWATSDGKTYDNVVITKLDTETASIMHSRGASHVAISLLPPDIQKQLNYDPDAASAARTEARREEAHPYYRIKDLADAQAIARERHWPLAWIVYPSASSLTKPAVPQGSDLELFQMAMAHLKTRSIVIFVDSDLEIGAMPVFIPEKQLYQLDDGVLPGGHHLLIPKVVFTDPSNTRAVGRVSNTQMSASREAALDTVLDTIAKNAAPSTTPAAP